MVNYTKKALKGASVSLFFGIGSALVAYITRVVLARNLLPEEYGLFYAVFTFLMFFLFFRDLGLNQAMVKYIAEFRIGEKFNEIKTTIFSVIIIQAASTIILSIFLVIFGKSLAENYFGDSRAQTILMILVIYVISSILFLAIKHIFQGFQRMFLYSSIEFVKDATVLIASVIFFKLGQTLLAPVYAYAVVCFILLIIYGPSAIKISNYFKSKITGFKPISKKLISFGIPVFATSVGGRFIAYIDTLILTYYGNLTEVGIYNVVLPSALIFLFFGRAIAAIAFPMSAELWVKKDERRLAAGVKLIHQNVFIFTIPALLTVTAFSEFLITSLFGEVYEVGAFPLQILLIGVLFYIVASVNNHIIAGIGQPKTVTKIILSSAVVNTVLNLILIPSYGMVGAAFATTVSYIIAYIYSTKKICTFISLKYPIKKVSLISLPTIVFYLTTMAVKNSITDGWIELIIAVALSSVSYFILASILKIIDYNELLKRMKLLKNGKD